MESPGNNQGHNPQEAYAERIRQMQQQQQAEQQAKALLKTLLTPEAYQRAALIRMSNPQLYGQLLNMIAYLAQQGRINANKRLDETTLKDLAAKVASKSRHQTSITRHNK